MAMEAVSSRSETAEGATQPRTQPPGMVLVVGDDYQSFDTMARALRSKGLSALCVGTPREALNVVAQAPVALVIFDIDHPDISNPDAIRWLLPSLDSPVFLMGSDEALGRHFDAWRAGAAGLITRPIDPELVVKQVAAVLSCTDGDDPEQEALFGPDGLTMYLRACVVAYRGAELPLTTSEYELLRVLLERRGEVLSADALSLSVNGYETLGSKNYIEAHISRLRAKLGSAGARGVVQTVRGFGYVVRPD